MICHYGVVMVWAALFSIYRKWSPERETRSACPIRTYQFKSKHEFKSIKLVKTNQMDFTIALFTILFILVVDGIVAVTSVTWACAYWSVSSSSVPFSLLHRRVVLAALPLRCHKMIENRFSDFNSSVSFVFYWHGIAVKPRQATSVTPNHTLESTAAWFLKRNTQFVCRRKWAATVCVLCVCFCHAMPRFWKSHCK